MSPGTHLRPNDHKTLLRLYRNSPSTAVRLRCHILLLEAGHPWELIVTVLFTSTATINRWRRVYLRDGIDAVLAGGARTPAHPLVGGDDCPLGGRPFPDGLRLRAEQVVL